MQTVKLKLELERFLENLALYFYDNAYKTLIVMLTVCALLGIGISKLEVETTVEGLFKSGDITFANYDAFRNQFGQDSISIAAIKSNNVFSLPFLSKLRDFHLELENTVPYLDKITSLYNISNISGDEGSLIVEDLMENFPQTAEDVAALKQKVMTNSLVQYQMSLKQGLISNTK